MRRLKLIDLIDLEGVLGHFTERFTLSAALPLPNTSAGDRPFELVAKADLFPLGGCEQRGYAKWTLVIRPRDASEAEAVEDQALSNRSPTTASGGNTQRGPHPTPSKSGIASVNLPFCY